MPNGICKFRKNAYWKGLVLKSKLHFSNDQACSCKYFFFNTGMAINFKRFLVAWGFNYDWKLDEKENDFISLRIKRKSTFPTFRLGHWPSFRVVPSVYSISFLGYFHKERSSGWLIMYTCCCFGFLILYYSLCTGNDCFS